MMKSSKLRVLLVDDEVEFTSTLAERLNLRGMDASTCDSGEKALEMIRDDPPHVAVLDMLMPGISGIEMLSEIKKSYPGVGVIFLTGKLAPGSIDPRLTGSCDYLVKPVNIDELVAKIRRCAADDGSP